MKPIPAPKKGTLLFGSIEPYRPAKDEDYMNEAQKAHFSKILNLWHDDLVAEANRTVHHLQTGGANNLPDPNDRATQEEEFALELRTRDRERKLLKKIAKSLQSLAEDDYGYCVTCDEEIGIRRLEARPTATLCIDCKELAEIKERHVAG